MGILKLRTYVVSMGNNLIVAETINDSLTPIGNVPQDPDKRPRTHNIFDGHVVVLVEIRRKKRRQTVDHSVYGVDELITPFEQQGSKVVKIDKGLVPVSLRFQSRKPDNVSDDWINQLRTIGAGPESQPFLEFC